MRGPDPTDERSSTEIAGHAKCFQEGIRAGWTYAFLNSAVTGIGLYAGTRKVPWIKKSINHAGIAFLTSSVFASSFAFNADKKALACKKRERDLARSLKKKRRSAGSSVRDTHM